MKQVIDTDELVQHFNDDEAVWRNCARKRELHRMLGPESTLSEAVLDYLDRLEAERECRKMRCIGFITDDK